MWLTNKIVIEKKIIIIIIIIVVVVVVVIVIIKMGVIYMYANLSTAYIENQICLELLSP